VSTGLDLYRELVGEHARIPDSTVETYLTLAARRHTATAFGAVFTEAMVWFAADAIEKGRASGALDVDPNLPTRPDPAAPPKPMGPTRFWLAYLDIVNTRAAGAPQIVSV
jgi:hypothetical protein